MQGNNHFNEVLQDITQSPKAQRTQVLVSGIAQTLTQSGNQQTQQLGQELNQMQKQLIDAVQQN